MKKWISAAVIAMTILTGCKSSAPETPQTMAASKSLRHLEAVIETGTTYQTFTAALAEAKESVSEYERGSEMEAETDIKFQNAINWYDAANQVWALKIQDELSYDRCADSHNYQTAGICKVYPELTSMVYRNATEKVPGIDYEKALDTAFEKAKLR